MNDAFLLLTPLLMLPIVALLGFVGCDKFLGFEHIPNPLPGPTNFSAAGHDGVIVLSWDAYTNATEYHLYRRKDNENYDFASPIPVTTMPNPSYSDTGVTNGTTYYYVVSAAVNSTESQNSDEQSATPMVSTGVTDYFVTSFAVGTDDNSYSGWAGMEILVAANSLDIHEVGRVRAPGNVQQHAIKIVNKMTLQDLTTVILDTIGGTDGMMQTAPVTNQVTLIKNTSYYIISKEMGGADLFYQDNSTVVTTGVATVVNAIKGDQIGPYVVSGGANNSFGPLTFQYTVLP
ncbi:MAG: hypothetical protein ABR582_12555 [Gemmatimonadaceae bacterium]